MSNELVTHQGGGAVVPTDGGALDVPALGDTSASGSIEVTLSREDSFAIDQFSRMAAGHGLDRSVAAKAAGEYYTGILREQKRQDEGHRKQIREQFTKEWGANYGANVKRIRSFIDSLPLSVQDVLWEGRTQDGALGLNDPSVLRWLLRLSMPAGSYQGGSLDAEIKQIEETMRKDRTRYNRDVRMQERYMELISARDGVPRY